MKYGNVTVEQVDVKGNIVIDDLKKRQNKVTNRRVTLNEMFYTFRKDEVFELTKKEKKLTIRSSAAEYLT